MYFIDNKIFNSYPMMTALEKNSTFTDLYQKDLEETKNIITSNLKIGGGGERNIKICLSNLEKLICDPN